ncbi:MAG TPA: hypothetical protein VGB45_07180 [Abditibacterium sp.]|jgi:hypothetical protein
MSGATEGVIYIATNGGAAGASAASSVFSAVAATGGVVIAGAAVYMVARKMRADYGAALGEIQNRANRESVLFATQNAIFEQAQLKAREMSLSLSECAREDPNTAFFLSGIGRLKSQVAGLDDPNGGPSSGAALLARQCDEILAEVAAGKASAQWTNYETLANRVAKLALELKSDSQNERQNAVLQLVRDQIALLRADIGDSLLSRKNHGAARGILLERLEQIETLAATQSATALQSLSVLRERIRSEIRGAGENAAREAQNAVKMRELVGQISAHAQSVLGQAILIAPRVEAEQILKKLSSLVGATPVELSKLEILAFQAKELFESTEKALEEAALATYLEDQVSQVLGGLGYRITSATSGGEQKMVAVLDGGNGVQLNIDGKGNLSGEMVAFSENFAEVSEAAQEKVCNLMDDVFDGLRRRNLVVREKKRKNFKAGRDRVEVVKTAENSVETMSVAAQKPLEMRIGQ